MTEEDLWTPEQHKRFVAFVAMKQMFSHLEAETLKQLANWLLEGDFLDEETEDYE